MPGKEAAKHLPLAHDLSFSTDSTAVTATGTMFFAASLRVMSSNADSRQQDLISAPVQSMSLGRLCDLILYSSRYMSQIFAFSSLPGRLRKKMPSNLSARENSGGS